MYAKQEIIIVCTHLCSSYTTMRLHRRSALEMTEQFLEGEKKVYVLGLNSGIQGADFSFVDAMPTTETMLIQSLRDIVQQHREGIAASSASDKDSEDAAIQIQLVYAGFPYLQKTLSAELRELHTRTNSDYTFADGYPVGLACEFLESRVLGDLEKLAKDRPLHWDALFTILSRDINAFDIETIVSPCDYRAMHAHLTTETRHGFSVCKKLAALGAEDAVQRVTTLIDENRGVLRTIPNYIHIELTRNFEYTPRYAPVQQNLAQQNPAQQSSVQNAQNNSRAATKHASHMRLEDFKQVLDAAKKLNETCTLEIGSYGELSKHPDICRMLDIVEEQSLNTILITSGLGWQEDAIQYICKAGYHWISFVVIIEGYNEKSYRVHRDASFSESRNVLLALHAAYPGRAYVETVRMAEYEHELLPWYNYWKESGVSVNVRKYNDFSGRLPQRKSSDLSPLQRHVCWQLEREMTIDASGNVLQCTQDIDAAFALGNVFTDGLQASWDKLEDRYAQQLQQSYPNICANCDEYYIFNG